MGSPLRAHTTDPALFLERVITLLTKACMLVVIFLPSIAAVEMVVSTFFPEWYSGHLRLDSGGHSIVSITLLRMVIFFMAGIWLLMPVRLSLGRAVVIAGSIFLAVAVVCALFSTCRHDSVLVLLQYFSFALFFLVTADMFRGEKAAQSFILMALLTGFIVCCSGLLVFGAAAKSGEAVYSSFYQADIFAGFLALLLPLSLALYLGARGWREATVFGLLSLVFMVCLILTYSRGGLISVVVAFAVLLGGLWLRDLRQEGRGALLLRLLVFGLATLLLLAALSHGNAHLQVSSKAKARFTELVSDRDTSREARWAFWKAGYLMAQERPLTGVGLGAFGRHFSRFQSDVRYFSKFPHNLYLQFLSEGGWPLLAAFLALVFVLLRALHGIWAKAPRGSPRAVMTLGIFASAVASLLHALVDVDWEFPILPLFLFGLIALAFGMRARDEGRGEPPAGEERLLFPGVRRQMALQFSLSLVLLVLIPLSASYFLAVQVYALSGRMMRDRGEYLQAVDAYRMSLRFDPGNSETARCLADAYLRIFMKQRSPELLSKALDAQELAVRNDPYRAVNVHLLGKINMEMGRAEEARALFERALRLDGLNYPSFYNDLAAYYSQKGDLPNAKSLYEIPLSLYSEKAFGDMWYFRVDAVKEQLLETRMGLANVLGQTGERARARALYREVLAVDGRQAAAWLGLGFLDFSEKKFGEAAQSFQKVVALEPRFGQARLFLGLCWRSLGMQEKAEREIREAIRLDPALKSFPLLRAR